MADDCLYNDVGVEPTWGSTGATNPNKARTDGESDVSRRVPYHGPTHPYYRRLFSTWEFYRQSYEGGSEYLQNQLFKHPKEDTKFYNQRLTRAVVLNHTRVVADTYASLLYQSKVTRTAPDASVADLLGALWADVDMLGTTSNVFWQETVTWSQVYGAVHVLVDRWEPSQTPTTRAEERDGGRRPYLRLVEPQDLVDWQVSRRGELEWAAIREPQYVQRTFAQPATVQPERVRVWTRTGWFLYESVASSTDQGEGSEVTLKKVDEGEHPCGRVPLVTLRLGKRMKGHHPLGGSMMRDLAPLQRRAINLLSLIDEQLYQNVFNIMFMPESTFERLAGLNFSVGGVIPVADNASVLPQYLAPSLETVTSLRGEIRSTEQAIRFASGLGRQNEDSRAAQSGDSLAYQTVDKTALVRAMGSSAADAEARVYDLVIRWMFPETELSVDPPEYRVEIAPGLLEQELEDGMKFLSIVTNDETQAEARAQIVRSYLGPRMQDTTRLNELIERVRQERGVITGMQSANDSPEPSGVGGLFGGL